ncbi:filamentous hemagglutinin family N-terminal domain-containing protein [Selenomonas ruminantium]|uniref:Filamentous hemagglutinin family N-terminal domain-containing protein n=2 Tax=Selenomonas ruminantium TaxID=971 RepID=A0A1H3VFU7_SELRU|nr:filamentous hemagglutinin family N-terminal domain-containing protein [Selenomonas ruminantium]
MGLTMTTFSWGSVEAMPTEGQVRSGDAEIKTSGQTMEIDQKTPRVALDWSTFDIAKGETVRFNQRPTDIALNRILGNKASEIYGNLQAGGTVFLLNPQGILFGQGAQVDVGNLIASTAQVNDSFMTGFSAGGDVSLNLGEASKGKVINAGDIKAQGGLVALHAANVENTGSIKNDGGKVSLSAVKNLELAIDTAGKINFETSGETANAHTLNAGTIQADGGYVVMTAKSAGDMLSEVVNNTGIIEAKTASINDKGEILLDGGDHGTVNVGGTLDASGLSEGQSGGTVRIVGENTSVKDGTKLTASGDKDGGLVETSGDVLDVSTKADIEAQGRTGKAGEWLLDPVEVVIADSNDYGYEPVEETYDGNNSSFVGENNTAELKRSYINADYISWRLSNGTSVTIQAEDKNTEIKDKIYSAGNSNITVNAPIYKIDLGSEYKTGDNAERFNRIKGMGALEKKSDDATLQLVAQRNITINSDITSLNGGLNIILHADADNDKKGMVAIKSNISTNGGYLKAGCGETIETGNTGVYFGDAETYKGNDLTISTKGGSVELYGDVALGLKNKKLVIDTSNGNFKGNVYIGGNVDTANSYHFYANDSVPPREEIGGTHLPIVTKDIEKKLGNLVKNYYTNYLQSYVWKKFDDLTTAEYDEVKNRCFINKKLPTKSEEIKNKVKEYYNSYVKLGDINETCDSTTKNVDNLTEAEYHQLVEHLLINRTNDKTDSRESILNGWDNARKAALVNNNAGVAKDGKEVGATYLATITTELENWMVSSLLEGNKYEALIGGKANSVGKREGKNRTFRWETGPEGQELQEDNTQGAIFFTSTDKGQGKIEKNMYAGWSHDSDKYGEYSLNEPNNDNDLAEPYVALQWRGDSGWTDVTDYGKLVVGFIQETNSEHSGLSIKSNSGNVTIGGNVGKSAALSDLTIETNGEVKIGGGKNINGDKDSEGNPTSNFSGLVYTDNDVNITGNGGVNVGGRITSTNGEVKITSLGNINTNGITAKDKVQLVTSGKNNVITMNDSIETKSTAKDAVIIDAHDGKFSNANNKEITTGTGGRWKIYSYSPTEDVFGTTLNSNTYALWGRDDSQKYAYEVFADDNDVTAGRYIFSFKPVITLTADDVNKVYGNSISSVGWKSLSIMQWANMPFVQDTIQKEDVKAVSDGFAAKANVKAGGYDIGAAGFEQTAAGQHGYRLETYGKVNVTPRPLDVAVEFTGTYGSKQYTDKVVTVKNLVAGDKVTDVDYTLADSYTSRIGAGAVTRDVGVYENAVQAKSVTFADAEDADNYTITYNNAKLTIKPKEVVLDLTGTGINLDKSNIQVNGAGYAGQLVNGDTLASAPVVTYGIGSRQLGAAYGIDLFVDGVKVNSGDVAGNYRFNYTGVYKLLNVEPPQLDFISTSPRRGTASYDTNTAVPASSVEKVLGLTTAKLPVMKEVNSNITRYGTYQLTVEPDKVTLVQADKNIPVPVNGIHDQYREYTKNLTTNRGAADFRLSYDGCILAIHPAGQAAEKMLEAGDAAHNVDVVSQALHTAFSEMGLELQDIDAVYVCFE